MVGVMHALLDHAQAPWPMGRKARWFENSIMGSCDYGTSSEYADLVDHHSFFWPHMQL
jgi:hypothetical protein